MNGQWQDDRDAWRAVVAHAGHRPHAVLVRRLAALERATDEARLRAVRAMRAEGWSWQEVGDALGVTHQAARQRWRARGVD